MLRTFPLAVAVLLLAWFSPMASADCKPTAHHTTGTHYKPVTEQRVDVGKGLKVSGRVLAAPDCRPVANARVAHWQAGEEGFYVDRLRAYLHTDAKGRYAFETEWPDMPWPHLHFIVTAEGFRVLETQWRGAERQDEIHFDMILAR